MSKPVIDHRLLRAGDLSYDEGFNRDLDPAWVRKLVSGLERAAVGAIIVSERADGSHVVIDGQHRVKAVVDKWGPNTTVLCQIEHNLTRSEEAHLFFILNQRRGLKIFDRFKAETVARHPHAVEIVTILQFADLEIRRSAGPRSIAAVAGVEMAHRIGFLAETVSFLPACWGYDATTWDGKLISGVALFLARYRNADLPSLRRKLAVRKGRAEGIIADSKAWASLHHLDHSRAVAALLVDTYNLKRQPDSRLVPWS